MNRKITKEMLDETYKLKETGMLVKDIAEKMGLNMFTLYTAMDREKKNPSKRRKSGNILVGANKYINEHLAQRQIKHQALNKAIDSLHVGGEVTVIKVSNLEGRETKRTKRVQGIVTAKYQDKFVMQGADNGRVQMVTLGDLMSGYYRIASGN